VKPHNLPVDIIRASPEFADSAPVRGFAPTRPVWPRSIQPPPVLERTLRSATPTGLAATPSPKVQLYLPLGLRRANAHGCIAAFHNCRWARQHWEVLPPLRPDTRDGLVSEVNFGRIREREPVLPAPSGPKPRFLGLEHPMDRPHCHTSSVRYRQVRRGRLICLSGARSFPALERLDGDRT
jgi:hypothetical protein